MPLNTPPLGYTGESQQFTGTAQWKEGITRAATAAEVIAGSRSDIYVSPATLAGSGGDLGPRTAHGVIIGEGLTSALGATAAGALGNVLIGAGASADPVFGALGVNSSLTDHGVLVGGGLTAIDALAVGATGTLLAGATGADPAFTASPSVTGSMTAGTTLTATLGDITATNGNFVGSASGKGVLFNSPTASGIAASPLVLNGRSGKAIFTSVSIAAAADLTLTITNSAIMASTTQVIYSMAGATTGSALSIKSVTNSSGSSAIVVTNGTGATTTTADIALTFLVLNT